MKSAAALLPLARRHISAAAHPSPFAASSKQQQLGSGAPAPSAASATAAAPKHTYGDPESTPLEELMRPVVLAVLGAASRAFMTGLNSVEARPTSPPSPSFCAAQPHPSRCRARRAPPVSAPSPRSSAPPFSDKTPPP